LLLLLVLLLHVTQVEYGGVLPLLRAKFAQRRDVFLVNFSAWHKKQPDWWEAFRPSLTDIGEYYQVRCKSYLTAKICNITLVTQVKKQPDWWEACRLL
jgi:hypothetical protein